ADQRIACIPDGGAWRRMTESPEVLSNKKEAAVLALLTSRTVEEAAKTADVPARTLYRWMKEPQFDAAFRDAKRSAFAQSVARLHQMSGAAVSTLGKIMVDQSVPAATRLRAADSILNHTAKAIEIEDVEARVAALEATAKGTEEQ
ncbi:MAG: hypothetical protein ABI824_12215, partial [Acidobacteriota bacterium]